MRSQVLFIIICITCSCSDKSKYDKINIDLSQYESIVDLHQYSDSLKIIKLATTQKSLISRINRIIEDDSLLFILDKPSRTVLVFHSSGRFYHSIHHWGKGPGEYIRIQDIAVDKKSDIIYIYDDHLRKLISYDYYGKLLSETYLPNYLIRSFEIRKNGNFLAFSPDENYPLLDGVWEFDNRANLVKKYADVDTDHKLAWSTFPYCTNIDDKFTYLNYYDNFIYTIDKDKLEKKLMILIKQKIPDKYLSIPEGVDDTFTGEYYMPSGLNETYDYYYFFNRSFISEPGWIHVFIEKKSNKLIIADSLVCDYEGYRNIENIFSNDGKNFFGVLESITNNNPAIVAFNFKPI